MPRLRVLWFSPPARELWTINREQKRPRLLFPGLGRGQPQQPGTVVPTGSRAPPTQTLISGARVITAREPLYCFELWS